MRNTTILCTTALAAVLANAAQAQMSTTAQLKAACESAPGNVVAINTDVVIFQGAQLPAVETVASGCTLVIGNNAKFAVNLVGLAFDGPFNIQSAHKTEVLVQEASISATSMAWSLPALDNVIVLTQSQLTTTAGDFSAALGEVGKFEVAEMLPAATSAIQAFGTLSISGRRQAQVILTSADLQAGTGVNVSLAGTQPLVTLLQANVRSSAGSINVASSGAQGVFDVLESVFSAPAINVTFGGAESQVKANLATFNAGNGSIAIVAGTGTNPLGLVEITQSNLISSSNISLFGSRNAAQGSVVVDASSLNGPGGVRLQTGASGLSSLENSVGSSARFFQVLTGAGGTCRNTSNTITGPGQRLCR